MELRPYQTEAVEAIFTYFQHKVGNPIVAMPTGTGKSLVIGGFIQRAIKQYPTTRIIVATHVKELVEQNAKKLLDMWPTAPIGIYSAGLKRRDTHRQITFAGIASIADAIHKFEKTDLLIVDECHLISPKGTTMYQKLVENLKKKNPHLKVIGFTATAYRLGLGTLVDGGLFTDICYDLTGMAAFNKLVTDGFLAPLTTKRTVTELDVSSVKLVGGEYNAKELQEAVDKDKVTRAALQEAHTQGADRKHWLVFASGVEHAEHIADVLVEWGVSACVVHGALPNNERDERIAGFKAGVYRVGVNNNVLTTGFDFPAIDMIVMLRPTSSTSLWVQMLGRGTRPFPGKDNCLVLDFAGNTRRLGPINDPVLPVPKGSKVKGDAPIKVCETCDTYCHASVRVCPYCGFEFPRFFRFNAKASTAEVMRGFEVPIVENFQVRRVIYTKHIKEGKPPSMKVSYYCGLQVYHEWVMFEHPGFGKHKAKAWWSEVSTLKAPETTDEALMWSTKLKVPTAIKVWTNTKFPEVKARVFDVI